MNAASPLSSPDAVDVYWRPGCGYCSRLMRVFDQSGVVVRSHNIWEDAAARRFVREHNDGDETVPTIAVGDQVVTNPSPRPFVEQLRADHPQLVGIAQPAGGAEGLFGRLRGRPAQA